MVTAALPASSGRTPDSPLILLGRDDAGKAHASIFDGNDAAAARKAALVMGMATLPVVGDELTKLSAGLPKGKLFESGRAFVPFVKGALYEQLFGLLPKAEREAWVEATQNRLVEQMAKIVADAEPKTFTLPEDWSKIVVGNLVLAFDRDDEAWFEAYVIEDKGQNIFLLRWRGWPDYPNFTRQRNRLALLHPAYPVNTAG